MLTVFVFMITLKEGRYCFFVNVQALIQKQNESPREIKPWPSFKIYICKVCCFKWYNRVRKCLHFTVRHSAANSSCLYCWKRTPTPELLCVFLLKQSKELWDQYGWSHSLFLSPCFSLTSGTTVCWVCGKLDIGIKCRNYFLLLSTKIENQEGPQEQSHDGILEWPQIWIPIKLPDNEFLITESIQI